ncbi:hypothetical protein BV20DRAFT_1050117 [Pilatotrama ljubarskyi]|nr:hypothetical protein BV20DRAFT_1050117 [Pilatotrama ljubarskyi]
MKFTSTILPAGGLIVSLAFGVVSQKLSTTIQSIDLVTTTFGNLNAQIKRVTENNVANEGPVIARGLNDLVSVLAHEDLIFTGAVDPEPFHDDDQQVVMNAVDSLVNAATSTLETLMDKQALAAEYLLSEGIIQGTRKLREASEDYLGYVLSLTPNVEDQGNDAYDTLDDYFRAAEATYES